jgi:hypothetical protein
MQSTPLTLFLALLMMQVVLLFFVKIINLYVNQIMVVNDSIHNKVSPDPHVW